MKKLNVLLVPLICFGLVACDGLQFDEETSTPTTDTKKFVSSELNKHVLISDEMLQSNPDKGYVLLFDVATVEEIGLVLNANDKALTGTYDWDIVNDKLQISYKPTSVVCTTEKETDDNEKITTKTAVCENGTPNNAKVQNTLRKALSLTTAKLSGRKITLELSGKKEIIEFNSSDNGFLFSTELNGVTSNPENGTYEQSSFSNVIKLSFTNPSRTSLLVLLKGDIASSATLLDLHYSANNELSEFRIYNVNNNNVWNATQERKTITKDN